MAKQSPKSSRTQQLKSAGLDEAIQKDISEWTERIVRRVVEQVQPSVITGLQASLAEIATRLDKSSTEAETQGSGSSEWAGIDSLSRLRSHVGGRFQNLKDRWLGAGFPLKEHRGEKLEEVPINPVGWLDLVTWLSKQGYEARTVEVKSGFYFEIKKTS